MNAIRLVAIVLIVAGVLGLAYGSFSYTKDTTAVKVGPIELSVKQKETVNVPVWAGIGAIVVGRLLLRLRRQAPVGPGAATPVEAPCGTPLPTRWSKSRT